MSPREPRPPGPSQAGAVTVWWARPLDPDRHPGPLALLDAHERERMASLRQELDRSRYLAAHALARIVLGEHLGTDPAALVLDRTCRCGQQHGKPRLAQAPDAPGFSLTHSGRLVGVALGPGPVGIDVEHRRALSSLDGMAEHVQSPAERRGDPLDIDSFLITWTRKEALLKTTGDGLSSPMDAITLSGPHDPPQVRDWTGDAAPRRPVWLVDLDSPEPDHPGALAGFGPAAPPVTTLDGDALLAG